MLPLQTEMGALTSTGHRMAHISCTSLKIKHVMYFHKAITSSCFPQIFYTRMNRFKALKSES
jgi:hypothetical protein